MGKNLVAAAEELFEFVLPFCGVALKELILFYYIYHVHYENKLV